MREPRPSGGGGGPAATDFLDLGSLLSDQERAVQQAVAQFVDRRVLPIIADCFEEARFPRQLVPEIAGLGLLGCTIDGYGCAGLNNVCYGLACQELERGDSALRSFVSVQSGLCMYPIFAYGSDDQKQRWLPAMARGDVIGCFGLTEPHGGSDPAAMKTFARRDGGDWVLSGSKRWVTNGTIADVALVWAQTDQRSGGGGDGGIRAFLIEKDTPGFESREITHKFSLRASVSSECTLDGVRVPSGNVLPGVRGLKGPLSCLTQARYGIAWGVVGAALACFKEVLDHSSSRVQFGRPLSHTQTVQRRLADMCRRISTGQLLALHLGRLKDIAGGGRLHHSQVSLAKWNNCRMALDVARDARDLLGAGGITMDHCSIRHMLNLESVVTYEGTETVHELVVGRELTGQSAF